MPTFSKISRQRLASCDIRLQALFNEVIKDYDCIIIEGHRSRAAHEANLKKDPPTTWTTYEKSKHSKIPSLAVDAMPYPLDWDDRARCIQFARRVQAVAKRLGLRVRWGGDWDGDGDMKDQTKHDLPHFELAG